MNEAREIALDFAEWAVSDFIKRKLHSSIRFVEGADMMEEHDIDALGNAVRGFMDKIKITIED